MLFEQLGIDTTKKKKKKKNKNKNKKQDDARAASPVFTIKEPPSVKDGWEVVDKKKKRGGKLRCLNVQNFKTDLFFQKGIETRSMI